MQDNGFSYLAPYSMACIHTTYNKEFYDVMSNAMLHIIVFHTSKAPYAICKYVTKFTRNQNNEPYILSHVVSKEYTHSLISSYSKSFRFIYPHHCPNSC